MAKPKIPDGVKLSIKLPSGDLKRLKIEAIERRMLESSIVLEALRLHWAQGASAMAEPVPLSVAPISAQADILSSPAEPISAAAGALPAQAEPLPTSAAPIPASAAPASPTEPIPASVEPISASGRQKMKEGEASSDNPPSPSHIPKQLDAAAQPAPAPENPAKSKSAKAAKTKREDGDRELYQEVKAAVDAGKISWPEVVKQVAPGRNLSICRSSWAPKQWIPAKYVSAARVMLDGLKSQIEQPAGASQI